MKLAYLIILVSFLFVSIMLLDSPEKHYMIDHNIPVVHPFEGISFALASPYEIRVDFTVYVVPRGFVTDLASIPRFLWFFAAPHHATSFAASILHDYLYSGKVKVDRKFADDVFYNHLIANHSSKFKAFCFWAGVRLFGWMHFKEYQS